MHWYLQPLRKYAVFGGRARRKEFWFFMLFHVTIATVISYVDRVWTGTAIHGAGPLYTLYALALLCPMLAVSVRRLHDVGVSGLFLLIVFVPILGALGLILLLSLDGTLGENQYGPDPKA